MHTKETSNVTPADAVPDRPPEGAPSLEDRLRRLEEIVRSLEADDLELDAALALFEEGVEHVRSAEDTLKNAELKVEELLGPLDNLTMRPLADGEGEGGD